MHMCVCTGIECHVPHFTGSQTAQSMARVHSSGSPRATSKKSEFTFCAHVWAHVSVSVHVCFIVSVYVSVCVSFVVSVYICICVCEKSRVCLISSVHTTLQIYGRLGQRSDARCVIEAHAYVRMGHTI